MIDTTRDSATAIRFLAATAAALVFAYAAALPVADLLGLDLGHRAAGVLTTLIGAPLAFTGTWHAVDWLLRHSGAVHLPTHRHV